MLSSLPAQCGAELLRGARRLWHSGTRQDPGQPSPRLRHPAGTSSSSDQRRRSVCGISVGGSSHSFAVVGSSGSRNIAQQCAPYRAGPQRRSDGGGDSDVRRCCERRAAASSSSSSSSVAVAAAAHVVLEPGELRGHLLAANGGVARAHRLAQPVRPHRAPARRVQPHWRGRRPAAAGGDNCACGRPRRLRRQRCRRGDA